jgi:hypothetical protein
MEVLRVIVDELPEPGCNDCKFFCQRFWECVAFDKWVDDIDTRPDWCPLTTEDDYLANKLEELAEEFERDSNYVEPRPESKSE